jgi:NADPH-dependent 7-cyano-7-deazaguanine reductase QueF
MHEIDHLVKMANQIADNFSFHEDCVDRIRDHLQRFWAPSMRAGLSEYEASGGDDLKPEVRRAIRDMPQNR